ncbi:MAG: hypothetical protein M0D57_03715 [Sphingobacteriales bacterium JAD_PAG50586_3]|nr:MAG: hypothetical protein M0D57_03715 [Sphingobacteriales bacterium JAD_PAG50586_3]
MKKAISIIIILSVFLFACEKDKDFRDRYVGDYEGRATFNTLTFPHAIAPSDPAAMLHLSKHPNIDNALIIDFASVQWPNGSGYEYDINFQDEEPQNTIYLSDEGFLYLYGTHEYNLHKNCIFIEPDSLFTVVAMPYYNGNNNQWYLEYNFFRLKKK